MRPIGFTLFVASWVLGILALLVFTGCARFVTSQSDTSYENGLPLRTVTTKAKALTFWESRSALANFKATQTDKTQSASVGALNQETTSSNAVALAERVIGAAVKAAIQP